MSDIDALVETARKGFALTCSAQESTDCFVALDELAGIARECLDVLHSTEAYERALTAEAERDRLKAALREITRLDSPFGHSHGAFAEIARAALADEADA